MPWTIQLPSDELVRLITQLGIYQAPARFALSEVVSPVSIVDSQIELSAAISPINYDNVASAGFQANPGTGFVLADTGQLNAGIYDFLILWTAMSSAIAVTAALQHRNAANAANIFDQQVRMGPAGTVFQMQLALTRTLAQNERMRVITASATDASTTFHANIFFKLR